MIRVVKIIIFVIPILILLICCFDRNRSKESAVVGVWVVDYDKARIHRLFEWAYPHGFIIFRNNHSVEMPDLWWNWDYDYPKDSLFNSIEDDTTRIAATILTREREKMKKQGKWIFFNEKADSIEIKVEHHPLSGKYLFKTYTEKARRGIYEKLILTNDSTYLECFKWKGK